jgi:1-acyl-sn-glycerol-3-phosphate acyltransferase
MKLFAQFILKLLGWKITGSLPKNVKKCVLIVAPHTSIFDFIIGRLAFWFLEVDTRFLIKKEFFVFPFGYILKRLGGMPVNRSKAANSITQTIDILNTFESIAITITPEGTRRYTANWKKGFYFIAQKANVPIALAYLNYKNKKGGIGPLLYPSGNFEEDFAIIVDFYRKNGYARHPKNFNLGKD